MGFNLYRHWILFLSIATFVRINISTKSRLPNCPATYAYITLRASQFHPHTTAAIRNVWDRAGHWKIGIGIGVASPRMGGKRSAEWCWSCAGWITQPSGKIAVYYLIADAEVYQKESCQKNLFTASSASPEARVFLRRFYAFLGGVFFHLLFAIPTITFNCLRLWLPVSVLPLQSVSVHDVRRNLFFQLFWLFAFHSLVSQKLFWPQCIVTNLHSKYLF